jgi:hypothetical protein
LDAVHRVVVEEPGATGEALVVAKTPDREALLDAAVLDDARHSDGAALGTRQRFSHLCSSLRR